MGPCSSLECAEPPYSPLHMVVVDEDGLVGWFFSRSSRFRRAFAGVRCGQQRNVRGDGSARPHFAVRLGERLVGDAHGHAQLARGADVRGDHALLLLVVALEGGHGPARGLGRPADEEDLVLLDVEPVLLRELHPAREVLAHVVDDVAFGLDLRRVRRGGEHEERALVVRALERKAAPRGCQRYRTAVARASSHRVRNR